MNEVYLCNNTCCCNPSHFLYVYLVYDSNSIWAFASAGIRCDGQEKLIACVAEKLDENDGELVKAFKPQELSNTVSLLVVS